MELCDHQVGNNGEGGDADGYGGDEWDPGFARWGDCCGPYAISWSSTVFEDCGPLLEFKASLFLLP